MKKKPTVTALHADDKVVDLRSRLAVGPTTQQADSDDPYDAENDSSDDMLQLGTAHGPADSLKERDVLTDLLSRHGDSLNSQLRNLVVGFLRTLPEAEAVSPPETTESSLLVLPLWRRSLQYTLSPGEDATTISFSRQTYELLFGQLKLRALFLVALGAAEHAQLERLDAAEMTLSELLDLLAKGFFADASQKAISTIELGQTMEDAGFVKEYAIVLGALDPELRQRLDNGDVTPVQIFSCLAAELIPESSRDRSDNQQP